MKIWNKIEEAANQERESVVTIGNFDGVHRGHQSILNVVLERAHETRLRSIAITFDPHPSQALGFVSPDLLMLPSDRAKFLLAYGIEEVVLQPFTASLASLTARAFIQHLIENLRMKTLVIGPTTHLGKDREGTPERLSELSNELGFSLVVVDPIEEAHETISSSRIRDCIRQGRVDAARQMMGHPYFTSGSVEKGAGRGTGLGASTANLRLPETLLPPKGVYATLTFAVGRLWRSATNVGVRPTFEPSGMLKIETHLIGFSGNLVGQRLSLFWLQKLREETHFSSKEELRKQIQIDLETSEKIAEKNQTSKDVTFVCDILK